MSKELQRPGPLPCLKAACKGKLTERYLRCIQHRGVAHGSYLLVKACNRCGKEIVVTGSNRAIDFERRQGTEIRCDLVPKVPKS